MLELLQDNRVHEWQVFVFVDLLWGEGGCLQFGPHFVQRQQVDVIGIGYLKADNARGLDVLGYDDFVVKRLVVFTPILHLPDSVS